MLIHAVQESDLPELARLYVAVFNAPPWNDGWSIDTAHERIRRIATSPNSVGVLARDGDVLVSFALGTLEQWTNCEHFHLREMCTAIDQQRRGIGGAILDALVRDLAARSVEVIFLETRTGSNASAFYRKQGFSPLNLEMLRRRLGAGYR
jgi:ribosomal protein S18 acetylase RimI-like enzyme